ncbi:MAG TPA: Holliday junction resolvase RuvX [Xanthomonadaceae bacterium]|nr:Holliday junction resolvase RuvX [Xanthomonadaceae bacterium]
MSGAAAQSGALCVLGFDVGTRRIGVAVGNTLSHSARPLAVVAASDQGPDWSAIDRHVHRWNPARLVVGDPLSLEGEVQAITRRARAFAEAVAERYGVPVDLVDERSTSREADRVFARRRRDGTARRKDAAELDAVAASLILERWLQTR